MINRTDVQIIKRILLSQVPDVKCPTGFLHPGENLNDVLELAKYTKTLNKIFKLILIVGIGGSTAGISAVINSIYNEQYNILARSKHKAELAFVSNIFSQSDKYLLNLRMSTINNIDDVCMVVISKSGTTAETVNAEKYIRQTFGVKHTVRFSSNEQEDLFKFDNTVAGRFSVLSRSSLFGLMLAFEDSILELLDGAEYSHLKIATDQDNDIENYIIHRLENEEAGKDVELFSFIGLPNNRSLGIWIAQLFAETEGKQGHGVYPSAVYYPYDLHSIEQWIQDGITKNITETIIEFSEDTDEQVHKLTNTVINTHDHIKINKVFHYDMNLFGIGQFLYDFMYISAVSAFALGVDDVFGQPGVEKYKKFMEV